MLDDGFHHKCGSYKKMCSSWESNPAPVVHSQVVLPSEYEFGRVKRWEYFFLIGFLNHSYDPSTVPACCHLDPIGQGLGAGATAVDLSVGHLRWLAPADRSGGQLRL